MTLHYKTARIALAAGALLALSACANLAQVAPGTPLADVQAQFGRPNFECPQANGGRRVIWTQQPMGQYAWGANVGADGRVDKVLPLLTDPHFKVLETGTWSPTGCAANSARRPGSMKQAWARSAKWSGPIATRKTASGIR